MLIVTRLAGDRDITRGRLVLHSKRGAFLWDSLMGRRESGAFPYRGERGSAELMAPRVSWRWRHGWHLCGEISQFSVASGNWQIAVKVVARLAPKGGARARGRRA